MNQPATFRRPAPRIEVPPEIANAPTIARTPPPTSFKLLKEVKAYHATKPKGPRKHGAHPSSIPRLCPVKFAIYEQARDGLASDDPKVVAESYALVQKILNTPTHGANPGGRFKPELLMEFRAGTSIHVATQFDLGVIGKLWGKWRCPRCAYTTEAGWMPRAWYPGADGGRPMLDAAPCVNCKGRNKREDAAWLYVEPAVFNAHYGILGHYDGDVRVQRGNEVWRMLLEIKSINENGYLEKYGSLPSHDHIIQASIYAWLAGFAWIMFMYVDKNALSKQKEIIVPVDNQAIADATGKLEAIKAFRETKRLPLAARVCEDICCKTARGCPVVDKCWGTFPPTQY
jgi:hypothetical protein